MLIIPLLVFILPALFGISLLAAWQVVEEKITGLAEGTVLGLAIFTTVTYAASIIVPLGLPLILAMLALTAAATAWLGIQKKAWATWKTWPLDRTALIILALTFLLMSLLAPKLLFEDTAGGLATSLLNAWGDLGWHVANITSFTAGQTFPPSDPIFAGERLFYPFLINFLSAVLVVVGATLAQSVILSALLLIPPFFCLLYLFVCQLTNTPAAGIMAVIIFLFAGSTFGWLQLGPSWQASHLPLGQFLTHLPQDYTGSSTNPDGYLWPSPLMALLFPQRSFLFGMPVGLAILLLLQNKTTTRFAVAGILAGLLPLLHTHTILALIPPILALLIISPGRQWLIFFLTAAIVGLPEILFSTLSSHSPSSFFHWGPGWAAGQENVILFWLKNTGLILLATVLGFFLPAPRPAKIMAGAGLVIFLIANLFLFAPWAWDNVKLLIFWLLLTLPLVSWLVVWVWRRWPTYARVAIALAVVLHVISGGLDIWRLALPTAPAWGEWDKDAIAIAQEISRRAPAGSVVITAPYHNNPVALSGRPMYLGFTGHVWSHGGTPWAREAALKEFYAGLREILPEVQADYVAVGPVERQQYPNLVIRPTWRLIAAAGSYSFYQLPTGNGSPAPLK